MSISQEELKHLVWLLYERDQAMLKFYAISKDTPEYVMWRAEREYAKAHVEVFKYLNKLAKE